MTDIARIVHQREVLDRMVEIARAMGEAAYARHEATEDAEARDRAVATFDICARNTRLSILAGVRLLTGSFEALRTEINLTRAPAPSGASAVTRLKRERETEREDERDRDGYPLTVAGRANALGAALARAPEIDPDGRFATEITDIKARLADEEPEAPSKTRAPSPLQAPLNRAQRRSLEKRRRRASG